jgi:hypothetical protein
VDSVVPGDAADPGAIVVSESRSQIGILFGFLSLAFGVVLGFFSRNAVRQACLARGWRFDGQIGRGRA